MSTYLKPNIQLFADAEDPEKEEKPAGKESTEAKDQPEAELPKTQQELDALINTRMRREQKRWAKEQAAKVSPSAGQSAAEQEKPVTEQTVPADDTAMQAVQKELVQSRAELSAYKSGVKPEAVEDAVLLAIHAAEKDGDDLDDDSISDALKEVLKRHPEWKTEDPKKQNGTGFRVGAGAKETQLPDDDRLSSVFGNMKK